MMDYISFKNVSQEFVKVEKHYQTTQAEVGWMVRSKEVHQNVNSFSVWLFLYHNFHIFQILCKENVLLLEFKKDYVFKVTNLESSKSKYFK